MIKKLLIAGSILALLLLAAGVVLWLLVQGTPDFYAEALSMPPEVRQEVSDEFLRDLSETASDILNRQAWSRGFTEQQVNAWLATYFERDFRSWLPSDMRDPRVDFREGCVILAATLDRGILSCVVSVEVSIDLSAPNVLDIAVNDFRAGALPLPAEDMFRRLLGQVAQHGHFVTWDPEADPLRATITLRPHGDLENAVLEHLAISPDLFYVEGSSADGQSAVRAAMRQLRNGARQPPDEG